MKVLGITSYRCGSGYCFESISQILKNLHLNEIFSQAVPLETYKYENDILSIDYTVLDSKYNRLAVSVPDLELYRRVNWLINSKNSWTAKIHIDQLLRLDPQTIKQLLNSVTPVLLYREDTYERILSMILAFEMNKYRFSQDDVVPDITVEYNYERHYNIINRIIESEKQLLDIYKQHYWYKVYRYESLTHDPTVDFALFGYRDKDTIKRPKISFHNKEQHIKNSHKIKEDFKWKNLKIPNLN